MRWFVFAVLTLILGCAVDPEEVDPFADDFAPLKVGNVWKYAGRYEENQMVNHVKRRDSIATTVIIDRMEEKEGARTYHIRIIDSIYKRFTWTLFATDTNPQDTVITLNGILVEDGDSLITTSLKHNEHMLGNYCFYRHSVPDSLLGKDLVLDGKSHESITIKGGPPAYLMQYASGIGLIRRAYQTGSSTNQFAWDYEITHFNGKKIDLK